ncbi:MAG: hypothetical protein L0G99_15965, partial [Propionibacteriales bacterium]|nr:hypothetical protein [Propionibacteriales bacterium]
APPTYGPGHQGDPRGPGFGPTHASGYDPLRPIGTSTEPQQPITTGRDPRTTLGAPEKPPQSKLPVILVSAVVVIALLGLVIGAVVSVRADIAERAAPTETPRPQETARPLPDNQARFETQDCQSGLLEVVNHERNDTTVLIELRVVCEQGSESISADQFALFDKDTLDYYNSPPLDRPAIDYDTAEPGNDVSGWTRFDGVPEGNVTLLMLDPQQGRTAAAISIKA